MLKYVYTIIRATHRQHDEKTRTLTRTRTRTLTRRQYLPITLDGLPEIYF